MAFIVAAAPVELALAVPSAVPVVGLPLESVPVGRPSESVFVALDVEERVGLRITVVELLAETVRVMVELLGPGMAMVWMPVPTAGMVLTGGWERSAGGCDVATAGCEGMIVAGAGWPVTTPLESVCWRNVVWGNASTEDCARAAAAKMGAARRAE
jgi:hypothetical protein